MAHLRKCFSDLFTFGVRRDFLCCNFSQICRPVLKSSLSRRFPFAVTNLLFKNIYFFLFCITVSPDISLLKCPCGCVCYIYPGLVLKA